MNARYIQPLHFIPVNPTWPLQILSFGMPPRVRKGATFLFERFSSTICFPQLHRSWMGKDSICFFSFPLRFADAVSKDAAGLTPMAGRLAIMSIHAILTWISPRLLPRLPTRLIRCPTKAIATDFPSLGTHVREDGMWLNLKYAQRAEPLSEAA